MGSARPLDRFPLIRTFDLDETREALGRLYAHPRLELIGRDRRIEIAINRYRVRHTELSFGSYAADIQMEFPETDFFSQIIPVRGKGEARLEGTSVALDSGHGVIISPGSALSMTSNADYERLVFKIDGPALRSKLTALTGAHCDRPLKFRPAQDWTRPEMRAFRSHFRFLVDQIGTGSVLLPELLLVEFEQALITMFLHANRHNYSSLLEKRAPDAAPAEVRRAEEYIEANAARPITLEALAEVSGVSVFSLYRSFRKNRGYSPLEFAERLRKTPR